MNKSSSHPISSLTFSNRNYRLRDLSSCQAHHELQAKKVIISKKVCTFPHGRKHHLSCYNSMTALDREMSYTHSQLDNK